MSFAQELLHRSSTKLLLKFLYFSFLAAGAARRWLTKRDPLRGSWTSKRVAKRQFCLRWSNPLRRLCVSDAQACGGNANLVVRGVTVSREMMAERQKLM